MKKSNLKINKFKGTKKRVESLHESAIMSLVFARTVA